MQKQELIGVHMLLARIRDEFEDEGMVPAGAFEQYDANDIHPTSIHRRKDHHAQAIDQLLDGLEQTITRRHAVEV